VRQSPRRAVAYITDGHDARRDPAYSEAELRYIARMGDGWKTELEGGRLPLVGFGILSEIRDREELVARFEGSCQPWHDKRGTTGYKSFTFTLPKELSLYAEGHREEAKAAMYAGIREALARGFPGQDIGAVASIHTRNEAGEIHFHAHVLVGKFGRCRATRRLVSLNSQAGGNTGKRVHELKRGWKEAIDRELAQRLRVRVEQPAGFARPALVLEDGTKLAPLTRESRRMLDKHLSPTYRETAATGAVREKVFRLSEAMDGRILEVASGFGGEGWSAKAFLELVPDQARWLARYEKRVETLKRVGYLTPDGKVTPAFRRHYSARHGIDTPELQRMRVDLARHAARRSAREGRPVPIPSLLEALDRYENIRRRAVRLGVTREDIRRIEDEARGQRPTPENLRAIRKHFEREALLSPPKVLPPLPRTKGIAAALVDVQKARLEAARVIVRGVLRLQYTRHKRIAAAIRAGASRELFYAKERRLAQIGRAMRPIFWATRVILPRQTRRLELAIARCVALVKTQDLNRMRRRNFVAERRARLLAEAARLERPAQAAMRPEVEKARLAIPVQASEFDIRHLALGIEELQRRQPEAAAHLAPWANRLAELASRSSAVARGQVHQLSPEVYQAVLAAARMGRAIEVVRHQQRASASAPAAPQGRVATSPGAAPADGPLPAPATARQGAPMVPPVSRPSSPPAVPSPTVERVASHIRAGLAVCRKHRPELAAVLEPMTDRWRELAAGTLAMLKAPEARLLPDQVFDAARKAGRVGDLLERERSALPLSVPPRFAAFEPEIQRAHARFKAAGHDGFLSREMLLSLPPSRVETTLKEIRQAGLTGHGDEWALKGRTLRELAEKLVPALKREMDLER
jgi:hypothetical protein